MAKRDPVETKERILAAAEELFSQSGFDGTRVDDIAERAGVNKALIYYYFQSKNEILKTLFSGLIEDARRMLVRAMEGTPEVWSGDNFRALFDAYIRFVTEKRKIIAVAIAESAKAGEGASVVMEIGDLIINAEIEAIRRAYVAKGLHYPEDRQALLVMEFFTGLAPFLSYALYKDQWEAHYHISETELRDKLYQAFVQTHLKGHLP
jgi:TetR/AcrR family transcriptional regulator